MAHNVETMAFFGEKPWHGLGVKVDHAMTSAEAIQQAGLDWEVELRKVCARDSKGHVSAAIDGFHAVTRVTDGKVLGVVGDRYTPVQNREQFAMFDGITQNGAEYHTAGSLQGGKITWLLAKLAGEIRVTRDDVVEKFLLLTSSHDGTKALSVLWTPIRVVCNNTLNVAMAGKIDFYARHTEKVFSKIGKAQELLGIANRFYDTFEATAKRLQTLALPAPSAEALAATLFGLKITEAVEEQHKLRREAYEKCMALMEMGKTTADAKGTRWGFFNAVAEAEDYYVPVRGKAKNDTALAEDNRAMHLLYGRGADMKLKAWDILTDDRKLEAAIAAGTRQQA